MGTQLSMEWWPDSWLVWTQKQQQQLYVPELLHNTMKVQDLSFAILPTMTLGMLSQCAIKLTHFW